MSNPHLSLVDLVKSYDGRTNAVDGVSLDVRKGEFLTFLGPSGSGKTTTLMMIAGFESPSSGRILLNGRDIAPVPPFDRNIGMVFQNYALFPHMSAAENIAFPLKMRKLAKSEIERRVRDALALVNLDNFGAKLPREMSGGQQQRVALARAIVFEPDVLLLDEPLGALDKNLREHMQMEIKRIHRETGMTMIYVTHDQTEAMTMSDRVAVFNKGIIEQIAPPLEVYARPVSRFVGAFIGDNNFFSGRCEKAGLFTADGLGPIRVSADEEPGKDLVLLVRPEAVRLLGEGMPATDNEFTMIVDGVVHYGDSVLIIGTANGVAVRLRPSSVAAAHVREGESYRIGWDAANGHLVHA